VWYSNTVDDDVDICPACEKPVPAVDFDYYQEQASLTANMTLSNHQRILNWSLGLAGEVGEVIDLIKKAYYHKHCLNGNEISEELGDVLWYLAMLAKELGFNLQQIAVDNLKKLERRYEDGFSSEASINRYE